MKVKILKDREVHGGFFRIRKVALQFERFAGGFSRPMEMECVERGEAVAVILYDPRADALVMVRQFRIGAFLAGGSGWTLEIVAGSCGDAFDLTAVARREVLEETGYPIYDLRPVHSYFLSASGSTERLHLFLGLVDTAQPPQGGGGLDQENEDIQVEVMPFAAVWQEVERGGIDSATGLLAMEWLKGQRAALGAAV